VKEAFFCLAHALIIAMAWVNGDPNTDHVDNGYALKKPVEEFLKAYGVDLSNRGGGV